MTCQNWTQFLLRVPIDAPPLKIYEAWTTQAGLENWFLRVAEFSDPDGQKRRTDESFRAGDRYRWLWHGYPDDTVEEREVIEANGRDRLQFRFSGDCTVTVSVKSEAGETIAELCQDIPGPDDAARIPYFRDCSLGWTFYLTNLKSVLEGGIDLRNKNLNLPNVVNA